MDGQIFLLKNKNQIKYVFVAFSTTSGYTKLHKINCDWRFVALQSYKKRARIP